MMLTTTQGSYTPPLLNTTAAPTPPLNSRDILHAARDYNKGRNDDYKPASSSHEDYTKRDPYREAAVEQRGGGGWSRVDQESRDIAREAMTG